jgi:vitamin B12 transporter
VYNRSNGDAWSYHEETIMHQKHLIAALLCSFPAIAGAAEVSGDEIIVTATRIEQPRSQALSHVTVLDAEKIAGSGAADLPSLLRKQAGIEVTQSGGIGSQSSLFLRGSNSNHTLVLLDGVRISSATTGATAIDQLMLDQVERIEIVRGNVSSLYGSDAIGGVIQIFTKQGHGEPGANLSAQAGSHNTQRASVGFGGDAGNTRFNLQASTFKTDGISSINTTIAPAANPNNNGYDNQSLSGKLRHSFNDDHSLSASAFTSKGRISTDNAFGAATTDVNQGDSSLNKFALASDNRLADTWQSHLQASLGTDELVSYLNGAKSSNFLTDNRMLGWQNDVSLGESGKLLLGAEGLEQRVTSNTLYSRTSRRVKSLYSGYTGLFGAHQLQANLREDRYSDFGTASTGLIGYGFNFDDNWRASASYSTAFHAPTFNDMYWPAAWGYQGNANLKPERSKNLEVGLHYHSSGQHLDLVYFDNRIRDLIDPGVTMPVNLNQVRIDGYELGYGGQFGDTSLTAALTLQNPRDEQTGLRLIRRAKVFGNLGISQTLGAWKLGGEVRFSDVRQDNHITAWPTQRVTLNSYQLFGLSASYAWSKQLSIALRGDNLTNQQYALLHGYNTLGRTFSIGLNWQQ